MTVRSPPPVDPTGVQPTTRCGTSPGQSRRIRACPSGSRWALSPGTGRTASTPTVGPASARAPRTATAATSVYVPGGGHRASAGPGQSSGGGSASVRSSVPGSGAPPGHVTSRTSASSAPVQANRTAPSTGRAVSVRTGSGQGCTVAVVRRPGEGTVRPSDVR